MSSVPIELPLKPSEAAALADLIFQYAEGRPLNDDIRNRLNVPRAVVDDGDQGVASRPRRHRCCRIPGCLIRLSLPGRYGSPHGGV